MVGGKASRAEDAATRAHGAKTENNSATATMSDESDARHERVAPDGKRRRVAALQDARATADVPGLARASWTAPVLWRF